MMNENNNKLFKLNDTSGMATSFRKQVNLKRSVNSNCQSYLVGPTAKTMSTLFGFKKKKSDATTTFD